MSRFRNIRVLKEYFGVSVKPNQMVVALAGNPNVGKSTVFNALTGLKQHTGNWPGKTVDYALGSFMYAQQDFLIIDLPGTYSILAHSAEEEIARDFLSFGKPDVTVVVVDATSLERNLNIALQVLEITPKVVLCVNLIDEAKKKNISIDLFSLEQDLGVPVVATAARKLIGLDALKKSLFQVARGLRTVSPIQISYPLEVEDAIKKLLPFIESFGISTSLDPRWVALRLLDGDERLIDQILKYHLFHDLSFVTKEVEFAL